MPFKKTSLLLGTTKENEKIYINEKQRSMHTHIVGSIGEGKSKFMEHMIRQDIINEQGLCLIDPHGYLYEDIVRWCETKGFLGRKKIILFNPLEENWTFGFNPLNVKTKEVSFHVDGMVKACAKVWGDENTDRTPLLKRCLRIVFHALVEKKLTLLESQYLINQEQSKARKYITDDIQDDFIRKEWSYFNNLNESDFYEKFGSTSNRMMEFLSSPIIRNIIGQKDNIIDFTKIMDEGYIVLINLSSKDRISEDNASLLGSLIVNDLFTNAKGRTEAVAKKHPFYFYIDECSLFINEDIKRILIEGRKFGLHLVLAHQTLAQLKEAGLSIYHAVMAVKSKAVFGGLDAEEAEALAKNIFIGEIDLEEAKTTLNKPVVVGYIKTWMKNYSQSTGHTEGTSSTSVNGTTETLDSEGEVIKTGSSESEASGYSSSDSYSHSKGASEALKPIFEERPTQVYSLKEQIYKAMATMVNQPTQHAIIKLPKKRTRFVKTPTIKSGYANEERVKRFKLESYKMTEFIQPYEQAEKKLIERKKLITHQPETDESENTWIKKKKSKKT